METTYKNSAHEITLENAVNAYKYGIATIVNDGKHITLKLEEEVYEE